MSADYHSLAREFLDLWQQQTRQMMTDGTLLRQSAGMIQEAFSSPPATDFNAAYAFPPQLTPLHIGLQHFYWQNMLGALGASSCMPASRDGQPFGENNTTTLFALMRRINEDSDFSASVRAEWQRRMQQHMKRMQAYSEAQYERELDEPEAVWHMGNCRLLAYTPDTENTNDALLLIPSLINRYHILDLTSSTSFTRWLASQNIAVYMIDWGAPGEQEKTFDCEDYVTRYLCSISEWLRAQGHTSLTAAGHCMGGLLALALASIRPKLVDRLALLATPWDFSADPLHPLCQTEGGEDMMERYIDQFDFFPGEHILAMFYLRDPWLFQEKLEYFETLNAGSEAYERFLAIEHWVNGSVPLTKGVARDGFIRWGIHNEPFNGAWRVGGRLINPEAIEQPSFVVTPLRDRIAPYPCSYPLARALPNATHIEPDTGHVGMIVGSQAKEQMWQPFVEWIGAH